MKAIQRKNEKKRKRVKCCFCNTYLEQGITQNIKKKIVTIGEGCPVCTQLLLKAIKTESGRETVKNILKVYRIENPEVVKELECQQVFTKSPRKCASNEVQEDA